jgi:two-component system response regulator NreC
MSNIKVLVADEQNLFREGVCALLKMHKELEVVGEAGDGKETIEKVREKSPDVVLMNLAMPVLDGTEVTHQIHKLNSAIKVLLLTQYEDSDRVLGGLKAGANGCIPTRVTASDLISAILTVFRGECYLYPSVAKTMMDEYFQLIKQPASPDPYDRLTHREREVLKLTAEGLRSEEIGRVLDIAVKTVLMHRSSTMKKLSMRNQRELVKYAIRKRLINLEM